MLFSRFRHTSCSALLALDGHFGHCFVSRSAVRDPSVRLPSVLLRGGPSVVNLELPGQKMDSLHTRPTSSFYKITYNIAPPRTLSRYPMPPICGVNRPETNVACRVEFGGAAVFSELRGIYSNRSSSPSSNSSSASSSSSTSSASMSSTSGLSAISTCRDCPASAELTTPWSSSMSTSLAARG